MAFPTRGKEEFAAVYMPMQKLVKVGFGKMGRMKVPITSHAIDYGTGTFEGIRFYEVNGKAAIFRLNEHVERLFASAKTGNYKLPISKEGIRNAIIETVRRSGMTSGYIRPKIFLGESSIRVSPHPETHVVFHVYTQELLDYYKTGQRGDKGMSVLIASKPRRTPFPNSKMSGAYQAGAALAPEASVHGATENLYLNSKGEISELTGSNFFMIKGKTIFTPPVIRGEVLPGITRDTISKIAKELGLKFVQKTIRPNDLLSADEVFVTGTAAEVSKVSEIKIPIKNGKIATYAAGRKLPGNIDAILKEARKKGIVPKEGVISINIPSKNRSVEDPKPISYVDLLRDKYKDIVHGKEAKRQKWLTIVDRVAPITSAKEYFSKHITESGLNVHEMPDRGIWELLKLRKMGPSGRISAGLGVGKRSE